MNKEKFKLEYVVNVPSKAMLWTIIATPAGLKKWFADEAEVSNKKLVFRWGKTEEKTADILVSTPNIRLKFRWTEGYEKNEFTELRIDRNELTGDFILTITDFATPDEEDDLRELWDSEVEEMKRNFGI